MRDQVLPQLLNGRIQSCKVLATASPQATSLHAKEAAGEGANYAGSDKKEEVGSGRKKVRHGKKRPG